MKKILILSAATIFNFVLVNAQSNFQKTVSVQGVPDFTPCDIHKNLDGTYLLAGNDYLNNQIGSIIKMDANMQAVIWVKEFIVPNLSSMKLGSVGECIGGGYFVVGLHYDNFNSAFDCFLTKLSNNGAILWDRHYSLDSWDAPYWAVNPTVKQLSSGEFIICTAMGGSMGIIRTDSNGNILFGKSIRGDSTEPKDPGVDALLCNDGGIIVAGKRGDDPFIVKINSIGQIQWSKIYAMSGFYNRIYRILHTTDGGFLMAGLKNDLNTHINTGFMTKIDGSGNLVWYKEYSNGGDFQFSDLKQLSSGNYLLFGIAINFSQVVLTTVDPNGNLLTSQAVGASPPSTYCDLLNPASQILQNDGLLLAFSFYDHFSGLTYSYMFESPNFNLNWCIVNNFPLTVTTINYSPIIGTSSNIQSIGTSTNTLVNPISNSCLIGDYCLNSSVSENNLANEVNIFPNPISTTATIQLDASLITGNTQFILYDMLGKEVMKQKITSEKTEISRGNLNAGIYIYKINSGNGIICSGKLVIAER